jgi:hypothetical protein
MSQMAVSRKGDEADGNVVVVWGCGGEESGGLTTVEAEVCTVASKAIEVLQCAEMTF